jgi:hypothetical protein
MQLACLFKTYLNVLVGLSELLSVKKLFVVVLHSTETNLIDYNLDQAAPLNTLISLTNSKQF